MQTPFQFARRAGVCTPMRHMAAFALGIVFVCAVAHADDAPPSAVGRVEGRDVSVDGGVGAGSSASPSIYVSNGSVVTVHSGKARMTLFAGGKVQICGPAKFTVLLSGNAITLALNFGLVRAELPLKTTLRIFTPTIIGTPIDISGGARNVTFGLNLDDSLCVLATSGALQLEQQFTGEKIIVPESGEFFLNSGQLLPIAGRPGTCQCLADEPGASPPPVVPEYATAVPVVTTPVNTATAPAVTNAATPPPMADPPPTIEYSVLQNANQGHPVAASTRGEALLAAPNVPLAQTVSIPALSFAAGTPLAPPGPSQDTLLLIREARVSSEWQFSGHVEPPEFAAAMQHALGEKSMTPSATQPVPSQPPAQPKKKKGGFWAALKRAFGGS